MITQDRHKEIAFFNDMTKTKDYDSLMPYGYQSLGKAFHKLLAGREGSIQTAVDLGCGTGSFTRRFFKDLTVTGLGIDISPSAIARAQKKRDGIHYAVSDMTQLGIKSQSMDLVIFSGVLHHFPNLCPPLKEAYRILKPQGLVLTYEPHAANPCMWLYRHPDSPVHSKCGRTDNERLLTKAELLDQFRKARFQNVRIHAISGVTISYLESNAARLFLPFYNAVEWLWGISPFAASHGSFLVGCAQKP